MPQVAPKASTNASQAKSVPWQLRGLHRVPSKERDPFRWSGFHGKVAHLEVTFPVENVYIYIYIFTEKAREGPHCVSND